ncbi:MAG: hypothetical protein M1298_02360 [Chloroflexi bacterium]|nr:hypothetical protein [Chloroflexota bacterium]
MKITHVETTYIRLPLRFPYTSGERYALGHAPHEASGAILIHLYTDSGHEGIGEIHIKGGGLEGIPIQQFINHTLVPHVLGADPLQLQTILQQLWIANQHQATVHVAGFDIALHDLIGHILGQPISILLGGKIRQQIPLTWNIPATRDLDWMEEQARTAVAHGFHHVIKVKTGTPWDIDALLHVQRGAGDVPLRPDDNGAFLAAESIARFRTARDRGVRFEFLEQPAPNHDLPGLRQVSKALNERVMYHTGFVEPTVAAQLLQHRYADAVSIPVFRHGIFGAVQLMRAFAAAGIAVTMGSGLEGTIAATAALHVASTIDNLRLPVDTLGPLWLETDIITSGPRYAGGYAEAPDQPGLGVTVDWQRVRELTIR